MPIQGPTSYFQCTQEFINHWHDANVANANTPILLAKEELETPADVGRDDLVTLLFTLEGARETVDDRAQDLGILRAQLVGLQVELNAAINGFNQRMRADHGASPFAANLAAVPSLGAGREAFMRPLRDTQRLWGKVNTWRVGLGRDSIVLAGNVDLAMVGQRMALTRTVLDGIEEREQQLGLDLAERNAIQDKIYPILRIYRLKLPTVFLAGAPILMTLPLLTPLPGSTPEAPGLTGGWVVAGVQAEFVRTASPTLAVVRHQLRGCAQANFDENQEVVLATVELGQPLTFQTTFGLVGPGLTASYRLVAMTADHHEHGSESVVVTRPV